MSPQELGEPINGEYRLCTANEDTGAQCSMLVDGYNGPQFNLSLSSIDEISSQIGSCTDKDFAKCTMSDSLKFIVEQG